MKNNIIFIVIIFFLGCSSRVSDNKQVDSNDHQIETYIFNSSNSDSVFLDLYIVLANRKFVYTKSKNVFSSQVDISINISSTKKEEQILHQSFSQVFKEKFYNNTRNIENRSIIANTIQFEFI